MSQLPVIISHVGNHDYVELCLKQALEHNERVIFVGDHKFDGVEFYHLNDFSNQSKEFEKIFQNFSTSPPHFELPCITRWMSIEEVMRSLDIKRAFICDSDVLIYDNIDALDKKYYKDYDVGLCTSASKNVTGGQSFWDYGKLKEFVEYCFDFYSTQLPNVEKWYKSWTEAGGVCDMTLLYYFVHGKKDFVGLRLPDYPYYEKDITKVMNNEVTFDLHLREAGNHTSPNCYKMSGGLKKIDLINGKPHCYNMELQKNIRFALIHLQGFGVAGKKSIMEEILRVSKLSTALTA